MSVWAVIPIRSLNDGKTRLATRLGHAERRVLNATLLDHVVSVTQKVLPPERCLVVTGCAETAACAGRLGTPVLRETLPGSGPNAALAEARDHFRACGAAAMLIVPTDLPLLAAADLEAFLAAADLATVLLAPDTAGTGSNAMLLPTAPPFAFSFGHAGSFFIHSQTAARLGLALTPVRRPGVTFDLDTPADLDRLSTERAGFEASCSPDRCA